MQLKASHWVEIMGGGDYELSKLFVEGEGLFFPV